MAENYTDTDGQKLLSRMQRWARSLGFQAMGVSDIDLRDAEAKLQDWLAKGFHGEMGFMAKHGSMRTHPEQLVEGTIRVISLRMDYWPGEAAEPWKVLDDGNRAFISRYALGRDYHKLMRKRLAKLAKRIEREVGPMGFRVFTDSAPVMEKAIAEKAGLGWIGKHTNVLNRDHGSYFFLGEIYTDLPLPVTDATSAHCGSCSACIDICPTQAIVGPYQLDARRCISYLTIELRGAIPEEFRPMMGNRIYGCDDCQLVCPWNKYAQSTVEPDYLPREGLDAPQLIDLFNWTEQEFLSRLEGSPIRRIGYECWLRNIAVALGNAKTSAPVVNALQQKAEHQSALVREHVTWALDQHQLS
ncbi:tRNA epoxyqueuosine(34) reductase QueG [Methylophaga thiooxydans]|uniref:Epoxyqueuosine reductase n=1 Tax=Methylophaga thiooxydans DMS010 TaxID=637616 RepID=C0N1K5_9GAMM|nr:tRNA epoxyqueuosine(34) reductase QueG [Methylophaga thiooxydans]EEF81354.1 iron-sulfur cluster binding protein, putative [Methylophaga thiooxydans DMS010]